MALDNYDENSIQIYILKNKMNNVYLIVLKNWHYDSFFDIILLINNLNLLNTYIN